MNWLTITELGSEYFGHDTRLNSWSHKVTDSEFGRSKCSVEILKVNELTTLDLEHGAERFKSSTLISLAELKSTGLGNDSILILNSAGKGMKKWIIDCIGKLITRVVYTKPK
ncbi:hypothetical protein QL285_021656 [Trifolium repens]|jgi:hypothetical protein|nr:hypothetical protein QL285_021656 [Trifolium repens]